MTTTLTYDNIYKLEEELGNALGLSLHYVSTHQLHGLSKGVIGQEYKFADTDTGEVVTLTISSHERAQR